MVRRSGKAEDARRRPGAAREAGPAAAVEHDTGRGAADALATVIAAVAAADEAPRGDAGEALAALVLLRELQRALTGWEPRLIEAARREGASWADLAGPLGVASRQAAERRYLRLRPSPGEATAEQRVKAVRDRRAADRAVSAWARDNAADLRQLAGQITALAPSGEGAEPPGEFAALHRALGGDDAAGLLAPLAGTRAHVAAARPDLAARLDALSDRTERLRRDSDDERRV